MQNQNWKFMVLILKEMAKAKGIDQSAIAEQSGITKATISNVFNLKAVPKIDNFMKIADVIGVKFFMEDSSGEVNMEAVYNNAMASLNK